MQLIHDDIPKDTDIIHIHGMELDKQDFYNSLGKPWVGTLHGGGSETDERWIKHPKVICVSKFVADRFGIQAFVHTPVSPEDFPFEERKRNYFLYMAGFRMVLG